MNFLFDWGDTLMADMPGNDGPMCDWPVVQGMPNAKETLFRLSRLAKCHVATNAKDSDSNQIWKALSRAGLESSITKIFCFKTVGHAKPSAEFFEYIAQDLQVDSRELVMVGDNLEKDIIGAIRFGLQAIWYNPNRCAGPPEIVQIQDLSELTEIAEQNTGADR